jgi:protein-tyrosine phosphatase
MGMSRSATSVIMFIMRLFSMKLIDAFEFVKTQREATDPNEGFMEQLRIFEQTEFTFEEDESDSASGSSPRKD